MWLLFHVVPIITPFVFHYRWDMAIFRAHRRRGKAFILFSSFKNILISYVPQRFLKSCCIPIVEISCPRNPCVFKRCTFFTLSFFTSIIRSIKCLPFDGMYCFAQHGKISFPLNLPTFQRMFLLSMVRHLVYLDLFLFKQCLWLPCLPCWTG